MTKPRFKTVEEYLSTFPPNVQEVLRTVRAAILETVPDAEEGISYQLPAYKFHGWLVYFGGFQHHYSLFAVNSESLLEAFKAELAPYKVSKGTIQFPLNRPVPVDLIRAMVSHRAEENLAREKAKHGD